MGVIFNFHEVHDQIWLDRVIRCINNKFTPVGLPDLITRSQAGDGFDKVCHITVDDGDRSFYDNIFPILKKHNVPASIYVSADAARNKKNFWFQEIDGYDEHKLKKTIAAVLGVAPGLIQKFNVIHILKCLNIDQIWEVIKHYQKAYNEVNKPFRNMDIAELKEVEKSGLITIGAHTLRHPILANEDISSSHHEIASSFSDLAEIMGHETEYFAFPNGLPVFDYGERELNTLRECNCKAAFSTVSGQFNTQADLLQIPRFGISSGDTTGYIEIKLKADFLWNRIVKLKPGNEPAKRKKLLKVLGKRK